MASAYTGSIRGLAVKHGFFKSLHKGEDAWTQKPGTAVPALAAGGDTDPPAMDVFGVYDGHGGKQAATFASRHMLERLQAALAEAPAPPPACKEAAPEELQECGQLSGADWAAWAGQERLVGALPCALAAAFEALQAAFFNTTKESGTTATVAALAGWDLVVANVGDSCAFLDTGAEVLQVSGNHRLESSRGEQERLRAAGCEVCPSRLDGKPCGPLRVWPGGLAMSRTLGDWDAGEAVLAVPELRHVTLPAAGARLVIASDGLWDAVGAKSALHGVRGLPASKAAHDLVTAALKAKGLRDDITVLVVDALPSANDRLPPALAAAAARKGQARGSEPAVAAPVAIHSPGQEGHAEAWHEALWQRRLQAVRAAFPPEPEPQPETPASDSLASSGSAMLAEGQAGFEGDSEPRDSSSESEGEPLGSGGAFAALLEEDEAQQEGPQEAAGEREQEPQAEGGWHAVAAEQPEAARPAARGRGRGRAKSVPRGRGRGRARAVPSSGRKHALPPSGSPEEAWQPPKAPREAPASPMQTSEASSLGSAGAEPRRGRGRGARGRGRAGNAGRGRSEGLRPPRHVNGFAIHAEPPPQQQQQPGPYMPLAPPNLPGVSFPGGGSYSGGYGGGYEGPPIFGGAIQFGSFGPEAPAPRPLFHEPYGAAEAGPYYGPPGGQQGDSHGPRAGGRISRGPAVRGRGRGRGRGRSRGRRGPDGVHEPAAVHVGA